jgi:hypothetical protein
MLGIRFLSSWAVTAFIDNDRSGTSCDGYSLSRLTEDLSWSVVSFDDRIASCAMLRHHGILSIRLKIVTVQEMSIVPIRRIAITAGTSQRGSITSCISKGLENSGKAHGRKSVRADSILINPPLLTVHIISNLILRRIGLDRQ